MVKKKAPSLEEIKKLLDYDCPQGNGLDKISGIIEFDEPTNSVDLKKQAYKRWNKGILTLIGN